MSILIIPNSSKKTNLLFDGILFNQKVTFTSTFGDITLRRCLWSTYFDFENCSIETLLLDRCDCHFYLGASWPTINQNLIAKNCNIYNLCTQGSKIIFIIAPLMRAYGVDQTRMTMKNIIAQWEDTLRIALSITNMHT